MLIWTREALEDRRAVYDYIEADNPRAALALDEQISKKAKRLSERPGLGRSGRTAGTRELVVHRHYLLIYDIADDKIRILRMLHATQQWLNPDAQ